MIDVEKACEIAVKETNEPFVEAITDVGSGYVISTMAKNGEIADIPPLLIDKETGKTEVYIVPLHFAELMQGTEIKVPSKFQR